MSGGMTEALDYEMSACDTLGSVDLLDLWMGICKIEMLPKKTPPPMKLLVTLLLNTSKIVIITPSIEASLVDG